MFAGIRRKSQNSEHGLTLIEVLVALSIVATAALVFLAGITTSSRGVLISQKNVSAESLAKSEMEYVKSSVYYSANVTWSYELPSTAPPWDATHSLPSGYDGYSVGVEGTTVTGHTSDDGLQKITIVVNRPETPPFTLVSYKVKQ